MKRPGDNSPDPPGGRAAERLREFQRQHRPLNSSEPNDEPDVMENPAKQEPDPGKDKPDST
jgi:hypothetical protein